MIALTLLLACAETPADEGSWVPEPDVKAEITETTTVTIENTPELQAAVDDLNQAVAERDALAAKERTRKTVADKIADHGSLQGVCAAYVPEGGWLERTTTRPACVPLPKGAHVYCGGTMDGDELWLVFLTTDTPEAAGRAWADALLDGGHTVEPWVEEGQPPMMEFGDAACSGTLITSRTGFVSVSLREH